VATILKFFFTVLFVAPLFWIILANRTDVGFSMEPLLSGFSIPLAAVVFSSVLYGFIWGALIFWLNGSSLRKKFREQKKEIKKLNVQVGSSV